MFVKLHTSTIKIVLLPLLINLSIKHSWLSFTRRKQSFSSVEVQHNSRGVSGVSWAQNLTVRVSGLEIDFQQNGIIKVSMQMTEICLFYTLFSICIKSFF